MCEKCGCDPLARSHVYRFVSSGFCYPDESLFRFLQDHLLDTENCLFLLGDSPSLEEFRTLRAALNSYSPEKMESEYISTFGHTISKECPPYEAEYGQSHIFQMSQTLADITGFYRAFGLDLAPDFKDRVDHVSVELEFMHFLCLKEAYALSKGHSQDQLDLCREAQAKFLGEHLGQWSLGFIQKLEEKAAATVYGLLARLLQAFLTLELRRLGLEPGKVREPTPIEAPEEDAPGCEACPLVQPTFEIPIIGRGG